MVQISASMVRIPVVALPLLGRLLGPLSPLSPLQAFGDSRADDHLLESQGLVVNGQILPELRRFIEPLVAPQANSLLTFKTGSSQLAWISSFVTSDAAPICISLVAEDALICDGIEAGGVVDFLAEAIGFSVIRAADLDFMLDAEDVAGWLQLADYSRIRRLGQLLGIDSPPPDPVAVCRGPALRAQRMADLVAAGPDHDSSAASLSSAWSRLAEKGLATLSGDADWHLEPVAQACVEQLLLLDGIATVQSRRLLEDGRVARASLSYLQSGVSQVLAFGSEPGRLRVWSEAPIEALKQIRLLMEHGDGLRLPEEAQEAPSGRSVAPKVPAPGEGSWYVAPPGQAQQILPESELRRQLRSGELPGQVLVWTAGLNDWITAQQAGLAAPAERRADAIPPPPPPAPPMGADAPRPWKAAAEARSCPSCGATTSSQAVFCGRCGQRLDSPMG